VNRRAAAIVVDKGAVLLVHRIKESQEYWVLPGGSVETDESVEAACRREVREETGLSIYIIKHVQTLYNRGRREDYYLVRPEGGELKLGGPELSRCSPTNQYLLEWTDCDVFRKIDFQPMQLKTTIIEQLNEG